MADERAPISLYYDTDAIEALVREGDHRGAVGGMWDEIGRLQFDLLLREGLTPADALLDIGCGCLRGGVHFVERLEPGRYYGTDLQSSLLEAGRRELDLKGLGGRVPAANLRVDDAFAVEQFGVVFDYALAFSVFTHTPLNHLCLCLERLAPVMRRGGLFLATVFEIPEHAPRWESYRQEPAGVVTHALKDPFHYRPSDVRGAAAERDWRVESIGGFGHPRGQSLVKFRRV